MVSRANIAISKCLFYRNVSGGVVGCEVLLTWNIAYFIYANNISLFFFMQIFYFWMNFFFRVE